MRGEKRGIREANRVLRRARRTGFWLPNRVWTRDEIFETAGIVIAVGVGLAVVGVWILDKVWPVG
jgi:hypothetical protein